MAKVKVKKFEDQSATLYFVKSKSLTSAMQRASLIAEVLPVDRLSHILPENGRKKHTVVLTIFPQSAKL